MNRWTRIILAAVTGLTGAACTPEQIGQVLNVIRPAMVAGRGSVSGRIVDQATQKPVTDARVTVGSQRAVVDVHGAYGVQGLATGILFVRVEATGYHPFFGEVQVGDGATRFDIPLRPLVAASPAPGSQSGASASPVPSAASVSDAKPGPVVVPPSANPSAGPASDAAASPSPQSPSASPSAATGSAVAASPSPLVQVSASVGL